VTEGRLDRRVLLFVAAIGFAQVLLALFCLPYTPGIDEQELHTAVYAYQHYGRLFYPAYDLPFMYLAPPTKYWLVSTLVMWGVPLRFATAGLFVTCYVLLIVGAFVCDFTFFQRLAVLWSISATVTLYPFLSYDPENPTYGEQIGRLRPDDLVLLLWLGGLLWLEASRRTGWRSSYSFVGASCIGLASVTHWFGLPALSVVGVYSAAALLGGGERRARRLISIALGVALAILPCALALIPYAREVSWWVFNLGGDPAPRTFADVWRRHATDYWFLLQWMKRHAASVWAPASLLAGPASIGVPPVVFGGLILLAFRSSRVLGLAGLGLPVAVLISWRKSSGYELPEIALFLLACGWVVAAPLDRLVGRARWMAALGVFLVPLATSSPLVWHPSGLQIMDQRRSPEMLRAMGRAVVGPGASVVGPFYTGGADNFVLNGSPLEPAIDFVAEREFQLAAAPLHHMYLSGQTRIAGFVLTPETPSASTVYFTAKKGPAPITGFVAWKGGIEKFTQSGTGWQFKVLMCRASLEELSWVSPPTPVRIAGYVPRTNHCVNNTLRAKGLDGRFASVFLRRTRSFSVMSRKVMVPLLIDDAANTESAADLEHRCGCETLERFPGTLSSVPAHWLLAGLRNSDRTIRFYAGSADLIAGRDMALRFASGRHK
jgi:hypothetical protein